MRWSGWSSDHSDSAIGSLFGGVIVTETIFGGPGMGQLFLASIRAGDTNVVLPWLMVAASFVLVRILSPTCSSDCSAPGCGP